MTERLEKGVRERAGKWEGSEGVIKSIENVFYGFFTFIKNAFLRFFIFWTFLFSSGHFFYSTKPHKLLYKTTSKFWF